MNLWGESKIKNFLEKKMKINKYNFREIFQIDKKKTEINPLKKKKKKFWNFWKFNFIFFPEETIFYKKNKFNKKMLFYFINLNQDNEEGNPLGNFRHFNFLFINMLHNEKKYLPRANYMKYQSDINLKMRAILIDWLIDVHLKFKLNPKTLFMSMNILDRFLSSKKIIRQKLQLLGVTTLLVASKYEEIYAPETRDFVYISDNVYSQEDIFKMESLICTALKFEFSYPSVLSFLAHFLKILNSKKEIIFLSNYFMELTLFEISILKYPFSLVAASILICTTKICCPLPKKLDFFWDKIPFYNSLEKKNSREKCLNLIKSLIILGQNEKQKVGAIKRKYANKKFGEVSYSIFRINF
ncbi:cyclin B (nucleomorph) [Chroomonas mesostigmatica CCMP1168]|uniref:Cyclin B n=1 Tax=Chroomonas mesostigmatica CCMP1168 TaxID=1195612 RepID=J7G566_9CRYP|nr:cyclin B [Chroomonas mesostigmatica CCMP1168]